MRKRFAALLLCHRRPQLLRLIARQIEETFPHDSVLQVGYDRPTDEVRMAIADLHGIHSDVRVSAVPMPAVAEKENFLAIRNWQLDQVRSDVESASLWDDDHILEYPLELAAELARTDTDLLYADKRYFWNDLGHVATHLPLHRSVFVFRVWGNDRFPLDRMVMAPARVHDTGRKIQLAGGLLDIGYMLRDDRRSCLKAYARAGKLDSLTLRLAEEGTVNEYSGAGRWYKELVRELI